MVRVDGGGAGMGSKEDEGTEFEDVPRMGATEPLYTRPGLHPLTAFGGNVY